MIISIRKHKSIVSMKDTDIKLLEYRLNSKDNYIKALEEILDRKIKQLNTKDQEINVLKNEKRDLDTALDLMVKKVEELEKENEKLAKDLCDFAISNTKLRIEKDRYKKRLEVIDELKRQYKWYIDKTIEADRITRRIDYKDARRFVNIEGIEGVVKLYELAARM